MKSITARHVMRIPFMTGRFSQPNQSASDVFLSGRLTVTMGSAGAWAPFNAFDAALLALLYFLRPVMVLVPLISEPAS
ncbi:hypothetical protein [Aestuariispira insulae]|uniref:hypothetical protein n=1 Tax=Aestuariispira insulae TaxID=1461337 RepID=UPI000E21DA08|nr:hypothetical protein [Aestuariispira insulae]